MKIALVRGSFLNPFELQNYEPIVSDEFKITAISSKHPISDKINLPLKKLRSPADLPNFPYKYPILNRIFGDAQTLYGLEEAIAGYDIAHVAETYYGYTYQACQAKRRGKVKKIISTVWETIPHNNESLSGRKKHKIMALETIDHYLAVTQRAKDALIKEGINPKKISVINMGIDLNRFCPPKHKKETDHLNILCVARLTSEKGILDLINAFKKLQQKNKKIWLTLIGDGPLKSAITGYKNIIVKSVSYSKIHQEYQKADIFCLPSQSTRTWEEQYGMSLIEAMASGLPIVTTETGAIPEVCGQVALYAQPGNPHSLEINLKILIYNQDARQKLSKLSRQRAEKMFDRLKIAEQIRLLYQKIGCR